LYLYDCIGGVPCTAPVHLSVKIISIDKNPLIRILKRKFIEFYSLLGHPVQLAVHRLLRCGTLLHLKYTGRIIQTNSKLSNLLHYSSDDKRVCGGMP
jgi:hypothetical protein